MVAQLSILKKSIFGIIVWDKKVTVTIGDTTKVYTIGKKDSVVRIVNGKAVINNSVLMNDFGLDEVSSTHQVGDAFDSETMQQWHGDLCTMESL